MMIVRAFFFLFFSNFKNIGSFWYNTHKFFKRAKTLNNFYCMLYVLFSSPIQLKNTNFTLIFFTFFAPDICSFAWGAFWWSVFRTLTKLRKLRIAWRELIYRDTFRDRFRNPLLTHSTFVRFNSDVRFFDFANLGRPWLCPDDFSRKVYPLSFVCSIYFSSRENITLRFSSSRLRSSILFVDHNILENTCRDDSRFIMVSHHGFDNQIFYVEKYRVPWILINICTNSIVCRYSILYLFFFLQNYDRIKL